MPAAYLGIVVWGEGLSSREFPTSGTTLHILKCGICLSYYRVFVPGHLYFVYSYTLMDY